MQLEQLLEKLQLEYTHVQLKNKHLHSQHIMSANVQHPISFVDDEDDETDKINKKNIASDAQEENSEESFEGVQFYSCMEQAGDSPKPPSPKVIPLAEPTDPSMFEDPDDYLDDEEKEKQDGEFVVTAGPAGEFCKWSIPDGSKVVLLENYERSICTQPCCCSSTSVLSTPNQNSSTTVPPSDLARSQLATTQNTGEGVVCDVAEMYWLRKGALRMVSRKKKPSYALTSSSNQQKATTSSSLKFISSFNAR